MAVRAGHFYVVVSIRLWPGIMRRNRDDGVDQLWIPGTPGRYHNAREVPFCPPGTGLPLGVGGVKSWGCGVHHLMRVGGVTGCTAAVVSRSRLARLPWAPPLVRLQVRQMTRRLSGVSVPPFA